eukprot:s1163_g13.t1
MGRVRTKTVKKAARVIVEKYYAKLTLDFQKLGKGQKCGSDMGYQWTMNIGLMDQHLRVNKKITEEEEERERRMEFVPDRSEVNTDYIQVDADTRDMLKERSGDGDGSTSQHRHLQQHVDRHVHAKVRSVRTDGDTTVALAEKWQFLRGARLPCALCPLAA